MTFRDSAIRSLDALFDRLGLDAVYRANGEDIPVKVVLKSPDQIVDFGEARIHTPTNMMEVRIKDVVNPKAGDEIILDGATYHVQGAPVQDTHRLVWKLEALT